MRSTYRVSHLNLDHTGTGTAYLVFMDYGTSAVPVSVRLGIWEIGHNHLFGEPSQLAGREDLRGAGPARGVLCEANNTRIADGG